jgi:hypothetical protein
LRGRVRDGAYRSPGPLFSLFFQNKTATKSPFSAEILGSRKPEQRNNSELFAVLTLKQRITAKPVLAFVATR